MPLRRQQFMLVALFCASRSIAAGMIALVTGVLFSGAEIALPFFLYGGIMAVNIALYFKFFGRLGEAML